MIHINSSISIAKKEIKENFVRAPGPGGQKVNKTESAVQLRFNARTSPSLSPSQFKRLKALAGQRITREGVIVITANQFRSQDQNRKDALDRLIKMIKKSTETPKIRRPTKPSKNAIKRRLDGKRHQSAIKKERGKVSQLD